MHFQFERQKNVIHRNAQVRKNENSCLQIDRDSKFVTDERQPLPYSMNLTQQRK